MTLKNVLTKYPDTVYLDTSSIDTINTNKKLINSINFKTDLLIYSIEYRSDDVNIKGYKYSGIVTKLHNHSYDYILAGYDNYFDKIIKDIRKKNGIIVPCLYKWWDSNLTKKKVVYV